MPSLEPAWAAQILFAGDTHGPLKHLATLPPRWDGAAIIHLGDLAPLGAALFDALPAAVRGHFWYIPGNHDHDRPEYRDQLAEKGMDRRNLDGRVVEIGGVRVAGLGNTFNQRVWHPDLGPPKFPTRAAYQAHLVSRPAPSIEPDVHDAIWWEDVERLMQQSADILVTHEAPSCHRNGFAVLDDLALAMGFSLLVHGHHHEFYITTINEGLTRVMGVGLRGIADASGHRLVKGALDDAREGRWRGMR